MSRMAASSRRRGPGPSVRRGARTACAGGRRRAPGGRSPCSRPGGASVCNARLDKSADEFRIVDHLAGEAARRAPRSGPARAPTSRSSAAGSADPSSPCQGLHDVALAEQLGAVTALDPHPAEHQPLEHQQPDPGAECGQSVATTGPRARRTSRAVQSLDRLLDDDHAGTARPGPGSSTRTWQAGRPGPGPPTTCNCVTEPCALAARHPHAATVSCGSRNRPRRASASRLR